MSTIRMDILMEGGEYHLVEPNPPVKINQTKKDTWLIKNWILRIDTESCQLHLHCDSKASRKVRDFTVRLQEGSLFLVNKSNNFYYYFHPKIIQDFMDKVNINSIISENNEVEFQQNHILHVEGNEYTLGESYFNRLRTLGVYMTSGVRFIGVTSYLITSYEYFDIVMSTVSFSFDKWMMVQNRRSHRSLYIAKDVKLTDIMSDVLSELNTANLFKPEPVMDENWMRHWMAKRK